MKLTLPKFLSTAALSALSICLMFLLSGCPYSSNYKLDNEPTVPIDEALVGRWATMKLNGAGSEQPLRMMVEKATDYEYQVNFVGNINDLRYFNVVEGDTLKATAFLSEVASRRFLNFRVKGQYYIAELLVNENRLTLLPLCEHFTVKMIRNNAELRLALELHYKTRLYPLYDDEFSLREMFRVN